MSSPKVASLTERLARAARPARIGRPPPHILIASMPKSGSTFLADVIAELPGFRRVQLLPDFDRREHELDEYCLQQADHLPYVAQQHVRYSHWTGELARDYALAPVVLVRSLYDAVISLRDHLRRETTVWPIFFAEPHHAAMDDAQLEAMIVRLAVPWYLNFYMGWRRAPDALIVDYAELTADTAGVVRRVLAFAGANADAAAVDEAIARVQGDPASRFNVGVTGRGAQLRPELVRDILAMLDFYPEAGDDAYVKQLRAQGEAILAGAAPQPARPAPQPAPQVRAAPLRRWWRKHAARILVRGLIPVALIAAAVVYWMLPRNIVPGYVDDIAVLALAGVIAGRLTRYKPRLERFRREGWR